jgi:hypothetical protein
MYDKPFEQRPDSGRLMASKTKLHEKSPDYFGELAIDIENLTNAVSDDGFVTFKINGWKKKTKNGATYLAISVNRYVADGAPAPKKAEMKEEDFPF